MSLPPPFLGASPSLQITTLTLLLANHARRRPPLPSPPVRPHLQIAASSLVLAHLLLGETHAWSPELQRCSGYSMRELLSCVMALAKAHRCCLDAEGGLQGIVCKYKAAKRSCVATLLHCAPVDIIVLGSRIFTDVAFAQ